MTLAPFLAASALLLIPVCSPAQPPGLPPKQTLVLFGQKIEYFDVGSGPLIVLLHGLGSSASGDWGHCIIPLAAHHRVVALDQLGFGGSDKPFIDYGIQTWVDFLGEFLRKKNITHFTLVGESLGGWIAAKYTIEALGPEPPPGPSFALPKPSRLVLCDAAGHRALAEKMLSEPTVPTSLAGTKGLLGEVFYGAAWRTDDAVRASFEWGMGKGDTWAIHSISTDRNSPQEAVDGQLGGITIPTLVVWGQEDQLVPLDDGRDFATKIPGAKLVIIPDCGHAACIENPGAWLAAALPFLDDAK